MRIFVISLERSVERRRFNDEQFAKVGIAFEFLQAIDGRESRDPILQHYDAGRCTNFYGKPLTPGAVGCYASHYIAWQRCVALNEPVVIMEDDVGVLPTLPAALNVLHLLMADYPLVRLFGLNERRFRSIRRIDGFELIRFLRGPAGLQAYAVSPQGAATLLAHAPCWREPVDRYIDRFWSHGVQSLALRPYPFAWDSRWGSDTRIWESKSTPFTFLRKIIRGGEHVVRHCYNLVQDMKAALRRPASKGAA